MKKFLTLVLAAAMMADAQGTIRVGLTYDAGGKFDKSFNQSAYEGARRATQKLGALVKDFEPSDPSQIVQGIRAFANEGFDLVIGVGFANNASITQVAKENPELAFGLVDDISTAKNVASLVFAEQEGSYLVGYLAGLNSSTGVVGFVGGMDIPLVHKFQAGYVAGVKAANAKARVIVQYIGTTPDAWNNPGKAKEITASMRSQGADIIFSAAGASGNGVIDYIKQTRCLQAGNLPSGVKFTSNNFAKLPKSAAYQKACTGNTRPMFFIGVDSNQNYLGDFDHNLKTMGHALTSMVKRVDTAVYALIHEVKANKFKGGIRNFGLKEDGVSFAVDEYNRDLIPGSQITKVNAVREKIIKGQIKVPSQ